MRYHFSSRLLAAAVIVLAACRGGSTPAVTGVEPAVDPMTLVARQALANEASINVRDISDRVIAVPALTVRASDTTLTALGFGLADMLVTDLARSSQLTLVERTRMNALLREMQLVQAGMVDSNHAPRVGRLLGARRLVVGTLTDRGNGDFGVETRLVNTVSGEISGAVSARAPLASIFDAEKALAYRVFDEMGITLTPAERAAIEQRPTANITAFLAYSRGVRDEAFAQYASAAANFQAAVTADPNFGMARTRLDNAQAAQRTTSAAAAPQAVALEAKPAEAKAEEAKPAEQKPAAPAPTTTTAGTTTVGATSPGTTATTGSGATALAGGSINPSPAGTIGTSGGASSTQQQTSQQDRGAQAQKQPIFTTVIITIKQLP